MFGNLDDECSGAVGCGTARQAEMQETCFLGISSSHDFSVSSEVVMFSNLVDGCPGMYVQNQLWL